MSYTRYEIIEELKNIRLELFRSAASLDEAIRKTESFQEEEMDREYLKLAICRTAALREEFKRHYNWDILNDKEREAWQKLLETL